MVVKTLGRMLHEKRGSASIEFALVINAFLGALFLLVATGYFLAVQADIKKSIIAAERHALIHNEDNAALSSLIKSKLDAYDSNALTLAFERAASGGVNWVKVDATYVIDFIFVPVTVRATRVFPT